MAVPDPGSALAKAEGWFKCHQYNGLLCNLNSVMGEGVHCEMWTEGFVRCNKHNGLFYSKKQYKIAGVTKSAFMCRDDVAFS